MNFDTAAHQLLDELDVRHDQLLAELDQLNARVDAVLAQYAPPRPDENQAEGAVPARAAAEPAELALAIVDELDAREFDNHDTNVDEDA